MYNSALVLFSGGLVVMERSKRKASEKACAKLVTPKKSKAVPKGNCPDHIAVNCAISSDAAFTAMRDLQKHILTRWPLKEALDDIVTESVLDYTLDNKSYAYLMKHFEKIAKTEMPDEDVSVGVSTAFTNLLDALEDMNGSAANFDACLRVFHKEVKEFANK